MIPADLRVLAAKDLFLNEASLTGEAMPVEKSAAPFSGHGGAPTDLPNICFMGSNVLSGAGTAVVVQTGAADLFRRAGRDADPAARADQLRQGREPVHLADDPLHGGHGAERLFINGITKGDWLEALMFALAVAVGLTPEMLPMIVTVNLAKGAMAMSRKRVIVKRLNAIQNFGAMDVLCTDKTGTLTQDKIILKHHFDLHGAGIDRVLEYAYLNSHFQSGLKNLLDVAVLDHVELQRACAARASLRKSRRDSHSTSRGAGCRSCWRPRNSKHILDLQRRGRGGVRRLHALCDGRRAWPRSTRAISSRCSSKTARLNADGFRVIAVAYKEIADPRPSYRTEDESDLTLLGYIAFLDPPKESARHRDRRAGTLGRRGQDPDRRQRDHRPQDLPRGRDCDR